ncbi:transglutaminase family protein, partial [Mesorhizobium sp.]|uniref:transglutaminase-like domain-containing protein n=1 Tax=Mesorhizobium sp. TaxID=1871066 RepID=UPI001224002E
MLIRLGYEIAIECPQPVPVISLLDIHRDRRHDIKRQTKVLTSPNVASTVYEDGFGNACRRFMAPEGGFRILYDAVIEDSGEIDEISTLAQETPVQDLPSETLVFLLGSRYCETDHLGDLAWRLFEHLPQGWMRVQAICDYVHNRLSFGYGYARSTRTAAQAHEERVGVCRDFAHLAITLCRCMNIPARYVNGYLGDIGVPPDPAPMDFNAWFEAFLDGKWFTFDAR